jgi:hypothetical protein
VIARCSKTRRFYDDEGFYLIRFDSETEWGRAMKHRSVRIANTGLTYDKDSIFMFVHVRSSGFHLDGFGRSRHEIKPCEDEEVELHFSELRNSQLSPQKLWEYAESEEAHGLALNYGDAFTEDLCRMLCDGLFCDQSGLKVTETYVGWVRHMFNAATVIFPEKPLPKTGPSSPDRQASSSFKKRRLDDERTADPDSRAQSPLTCEDMEGRHPACT